MLNEFGNSLTALREKKNVSLEEFADRVNWTPEKIERLEEGVLIREIQKADIEIFCEALRYEYQSNFEDAVSVLSSALVRDKGFVKLDVSKKSLRKTRVAIKLEELWEKLSPRQLNKLLAAISRIKIEIEAEAEEEKGKSGAFFTEETS